MAARPATRSAVAQSVVDEREVAARTEPAAATAEQPVAARATRPDPLEVAANRLAADGVDVLHTIGGDDTNTTAADLAAYLEEHDYHLTVVGLPKTIDNDVVPIRQSLGADTAAESPFTMVLQQAGLPGVVGFMEAVIVLALLSAFNAQIYATSRLVYSMSRRGEAPRLFTAMNSQAVPYKAVIMSMVFAFLSVGIQVVFDGSSVLVFLLNAVGGCLLVIWLVIALSQIKLRPRMEANDELTVRLPGYPWLSWLAVFMILGLTVMMLFDEVARQQVYAVVAVCFFLGLLAGATSKSRARARDTADQTPVRGVHH